MPLTIILNKFGKITCVLFNFENKLCDKLQQKFIYLLVCELLHFILQACRGKTVSIRLTC